MTGGRAAYQFITCLGLCIFCIVISVLKINLQQLQVAEGTCFKAGFEVEKKGPHTKLSSKQVVMSEGVALGKKGIPHGPCLLILLTALL